MTKRIRIESTDDIDFSNPEIVRLLAKGYAVILKDDTKAKCSKAK